MTLRRIRAGYICVIVPEILPCSLSLREIEISGGKLDGIFFLALRKVFLQLRLICSHCQGTERRLVADHLFLQENHPPVSPLTTQVINLMSLRPRLFYNSTVQYRSLLPHWFNRQQ